MRPLSGAVRARGKPNAVNGRPFAEERGQRDNGPTLASSDVACGRCARAASVDWTGLRCRSGQPACLPDRAFAFGQRFGACADATPPKLRALSALAEGGSLALHGRQAKARAPISISPSKPPLMPTSSSSRRAWSAMPEITGALGGSGVIRAKKADRLNPPVTEVALRGSADRGASIHMDFSSNPVQFERASGFGGTTPSAQVHRLPPLGRGPELQVQGREPGGVRGARAALPRHRDLFRGARRAGARPDRRRPGDPQSGAQPAIPADDLRRRVSGPDAAGLPVLLRL